MLVVVSGADVLMSECFFASQDKKTVNFIKQKRKIYNYFILYFLNYLLFLNYLIFCNYLFFFNYLIFI